MTAPTFILWQRGLRGPELALLANRGDPPSLSDREKATKMGAPTETRVEERALTLAELARIYPAPAMVET